jgi:large subunit ribosomal protein L30
MTLVITQVKSANGTNTRQRDTLRSLGLRGMLAKVSHLVKIDG